MYVAVKGGEAAIDNAHAWLDEARRGDTDIAALRIDQIRAQFGRAVDRVMSEGSLYDPELAALALKQAQGDTIEAVFLLRAYRTTLPRFGASTPVDTAAMTIERRVSATFKDLPGGQILGPTYDYTHRLLDLSLLDDGHESPASPAAATPDASTPVDVPVDMTVDAQSREPVPRVADILGSAGLIEPETPDDDAPVGDITRDPLEFPAHRDVRLQSLARGDEGFLLALGYSTQRGYGNNHPFAGEIRAGDVAVEFVPEELGFAIDIGDIHVTECQMINQYAGSREVPPQFTRGYGLTFGNGERKAMSMALVDRALRAEELDETPSAPAQDAEFVLYHADTVQATGFVEHLKLPHYVDFQSELVTLRDLRARRQASAQEAAE